MVTYDLVSTLRKIAQAIEDAAGLRRFFELLIVERPHIVVAVQVAAQDQNNWPGSGQKIIDRYRALVDPIRNYDLDEVIGSIDALRSSLASAGTTLSNSEEWATSLGHLIAEVDGFRKEYTKYVLNQTGTNFIALLMRAWDLHHKLLFLQSFAKDVADNLAKEPQPSEGEGELDLFFAEDLTLDALIEKLSAIRDLYNEVARLLKSSVPLRIARVESGSLWTKLIGDTRVMDFIRDLLKAWIQWYYRNHVKEGKIASTKMRTDAVNDVLNLGDRLAAAGVDATELREGARESAALIQNNLHKALGGTSKVLIDREEYSVYKE